MNVGGKPGACVAAAAGSSAARAVHGCGFCFSGCFSLLLPLASPAPATSPGAQSSHLHFSSMINRPSLLFRLLQLELSFLPGNIWSWIFFDATCHQRCGASNIPWHTWSSVSCFFPWFLVRFFHSITFSNYLLTFTSLRIWIFFWSCGVWYASGSCRCFPGLLEPWLLWRIVFLAALLLDLAIILNIQCFLIDTGMEEGGGPPQWAAPNGPPGSNYDSRVSSVLMGLSLNWLFKHPFL